MVTGCQGSVMSQNRTAVPSPRDGEDTLVRAEMHAGKVTAIRVIGFSKDGLLRHVVSVGHLP